MVILEVSSSRTRLGTGTSSKRVSKFAWGLVVASGLIWLVVGIIFFIPLDILFGNGPPSAYSPIARKELSASSRLVAVFLMMAGAFQIGIGSVPFRMGEKWTWYTFAAVPLLGILGSYAVFLGGGRDDPHSSPFHYSAFVGTPSLYQECPACEAT